MANCSDVSGNMVLEGEWTPSMIRNLNIVKSEWGRWHFFIRLDDFEEADKEVKFSAYGCWSFDANLEHIGEWTLAAGKNDIERAYNNLCAEMTNRINEVGVSDTRITLVFTEEEGGCGILREACAEIVCITGRGLRGITVSNENYPYTKENLVKLGLCDNTNDIEWL